MNTARIAVAVLGSGSGTNFQALSEAISAGKLEARIVCVLSNVADAFILERARHLKIPAEYVSPAPFTTKLDGAAQERVIERLRHYGTELIALAGFMLIIKRRLLEAFAGRIVNIHPSLLPAFPGLEAWKQALAAGVNVSGCTVHYVDEGMDSGEIILQREVKVLEGDTPETLHKRIQVEEHIAYPAALQLVIEKIRGQPSRE